MYYYKETMLLLSELRIDCNIVLNFDRKIIIGIGITWFRSHFKPLVPSTKIDSLSGGPTDRECIGDAFAM